MRADDRPALRETWELVLRGERAFVVRYRDHQRVAALSAFEAVALGLMDGARRWDEIEHLLKAASGRVAVEAAQSLAARLEPLLGSGTHPRSQPPLAALARVKRPRPDDGVRGLPGPKVLHWWVTSFCPRRCTYCFAEPVRGGTAPDATLPRERLRELFQEGRSLGTRYLLAAGAEPLLRSDLPEVLGDAITCGLEPTLTTKLRISAGLAARLAAAGVAHISISLDSLDDDVNEMLVGARTYAAQVRQSIGHLRESGVAFSLQTVVTRLDPGGFERVAHFAAREGARVLQVVPYEPVRVPIGRHGNGDLALISDAPIRARVEALRGIYPGVEIQFFEPLGSGGRGGFQCDIGMTKLFFLPDGAVHRCYKLRHDSRLRGKRLTEVSLAAAWHDPGFVDTISPPRERYRGSACGTCASFDACHTDGHCIYQAFVDHGTYFAPDRACGRNEPGRLLPIVG